MLSDLRISSAQRAAILEVLDSGWLSMGPRTADFEAAFAAAAGTEHAIAVSSCTTGLSIALQAVGVGPGDEVVLPSLTFVADANVVRRLGATPVFADIEDVARPLVDPASVLSRVTSRTRAALVVHYAGAAADVASLVGHGFAVIEDAAHAVGPIDDAGSWLGLQGDAAVYSFFANKNLPLGEGGMVTTRRADLADRLRRLRAHGMTTGTWDRHRGHAYDYDVVDIGTNARITEVQAALGLHGLPDLPGQNAARRLLLQRYRERFHDTEVSMVLPVSPTTAHIAVGILPGADQRARVREGLAAAGVQTSFHYPPIHRFAAYANADHAPLPATELAADRLVTLPLHPYLTDDDIDFVASTLLEAL